MCITGTTQADESLNRRGFLILTSSAALATAVGVSVLGNFAFAAALTRA
jgi:hypothetical protein